ncbi:MAG: peptidoglycan-binding domain-containing protein [Saprospiraceae bacterium]
MKTLLTTLCCFFIVSASFGQDSLWLDNLLEIAEPGKCYSTINLNNDTSKKATDSIYLKILPPLYQQKLTTLGELVGDENLGKSRITIEIRSATIQYALSNYENNSLSKNYRSYLKSQAKDKTIICLQEIPARYITIQPDSDDKNIKNMVIVKRKVLQKSTIKIISKTEYQTSKNITIAIPRNPSKWLEHLTPPYCGSFLITPIQEALVKAGYDCPVNDILGKKTREVLIQFQKDNNLPEGRLDIETLIKLGVH